MNSSPKIVVLKMREIIYTLLLVILIALLIVCLVLMFSGKKSDSGPQTSDTTESGTPQTQEEQTATAPQTAAYIAGIYTTPVTLGDSVVDVEVTVDSNHINAIRLVNLSEATAAAFPLVSPSLDHIASQILETQGLDDITCPQENRYTSQLLLSAVSEALARAKVSQD